MKYLTLILVVFFFGCGGESIPEDGGGNVREILCNPTCLEGYICLEGNICVECRHGGDCTWGLLCKQGSCKVPGPNDIVRCDPNCDPETRQCACQEGTLQVCHPGLLQCVECLENSDCGEGYECAYNRCEFIPLCLDDSGCDEGYHCIDEVCIRDPNYCLDSNFCQTGYICQEHVCVQSPNYCTNDGDCEDGYCLMRTNTCYECMADFQCEPEFSCIEGTRTCVPRPETCSGDASCHYLSICEESHCVDIEAGIIVTLKWGVQNTGDLDLHFTLPDGFYSDQHDCFYRNRNPIWYTDENDVPQGPSHVRYAARGRVGPEVTIYENPADGSYAVFVYYYGDAGQVHPATTAQLEIWCGDDVVVEDFQLLGSEGTGWHAADIEWPSCMITVGQHGVFSFDRP